jgi:hypothetical protein
VEGYVIEDAAGNFVKTKTEFYRFWKYMRSIKDRVIAVRETGSPLRRDVDLPAAKEFLSWCETQPTDILKGSVIDLRGRYLQDRDRAVKPATSPAPSVPAPSVALDLG